MMAKAQDEYFTSSSTGNLVSMHFADLDAGSYLLDIWIQQHTKMINSGFVSSDQMFWDVFQSARISGHFSQLAALHRMRLISWANVDQYKFKYKHMWTSKDGMYTAMNVNTTRHMARWAFFLSQPQLVPMPEALEKLPNTECRWFCDRFNEPIFSSTYGLALLAATAAASLGVHPAELRQRAQYALSWHKNPVKSVYAKVAIGNLLSQEQEQTLVCFLD